MSIRAWIEYPLPTVECAACHREDAGAWDHRAPGPEQPERLVLVCVHCGTYAADASAVHLGRDSRERADEALTDTSE